MQHFDPSRLCSEQNVRQSQCAWLCDVEPGCELRRLHKHYCGIVGWFMKFLMYITDQKHV